MIWRRLRAAARNLSRWLSIRTAAVSTYCRYNVCFSPAVPPQGQLFGLQHVVLVELHGMEGIGVRHILLVRPEHELALHALQDGFGHDLGRTSLDLRTLLVLHGLQDPARDQLPVGPV